MRSLNEPHMCVAKNLFPETKYQTVGTFFWAMCVTRELKISPFKVNTR
jgi:hypothetical protein